MRKIVEGKLKQEIVDAYFAYFEAYAERDWQGMTACFDEEMTMFGTGVDETALDGKTTRDLFEREFGQAPYKMRYRVKTQEAYSVAQDIALVIIVMDMDFPVGEKTLFSKNNRTSALMAKRNGRWKILHAHWSQPDLYQDPGDSVPFRQLQEENRRLEELVALRTEELRRSNAELNDALAKVKTLKGILPICSHCKKIRDDEGYWRQIEQYIGQYTDAFFSHSICPDCMKKYYPDLDSSSPDDPDPKEK